MSPPITAIPLSPRGCKITAYRITQYINDNHNLNLLVQTERVQIERETLEPKEQLSRLNYTINGLHL